MVKPFEAIFLTMDVKKNAKDVYLLSEDDLCNRVSSKYWPQSRPLLLSFVSHVCDLKCINWQTSLLDKKWSRKNCFVCAVSANINYKVDSSILVTFQSCEILISLDNFFFWPLMLLHLILCFHGHYFHQYSGSFFERCFSFCVILICSFP